MACDRRGRGDVAPRIFRLPAVRVRTGMSCFSIYLRMAQGAFYPKHAIFEVDDVLSSLTTVPEPEVAPA